MIDLFQKEIEQHNTCIERYIHFFNINRDVELTLIQSGYQHPYSTVHIGPLIRDHFLLHFIYSGSGSFYLEDSTYSVKPNNCFLIYPYEISYYAPLENTKWQYYWLGISGNKAEAFLNLIGFERKKQVISFQNPILFDKLKLILDSVFQYQNDSEALSLYVNGLLRDFLFSFILENRNQLTTFVPYISVDNSSFLNRGQYKNKYVSSIVWLLQTNYYEDINVQQIADTLHLNRSYLSALFKEYTGLSIKQYLLQYRISRAKQMLLDSEKSIADISYLVGFKDPLYFSRLFKSQIGISPSEYRNSNHHSYLFF